MFAGDSSLGLESIEIMLKTMLSTCITKLPLIKGDTIASIQKNKGERLQL